MTKKQISEIEKEAEQEDGGSFKEGIITFAKELASKFAGNFLSDFLERVKDEVQSKVDEVLIRIKQLITISFLVMTGVVFVLVGISLVLEGWLNFKGSGFLISGAFLLLVAFLFNFLNKSINH